MSRATPHILRRGVFSAAIVVLIAMAARAVKADDEPAALYKAKCAVCHSPDGSANNAIGKSLKMRDLGSEEVQQQSDMQLNTITACGKGKMPAYKGKLSDDQIKQLVSYIRVLAHHK